MKKGLLFVLCIISSLHLVGCSNQEEAVTLDVMFFTELPIDLSEAFTEYTESLYEASDISTTTHMFLPSPEKLTVEMVAGEGDIYVVEDWMYNIIFDPVILHPLDEIAEIEEVDERFYGKNEITEEEHVYAVGLDHDSPLFMELGIEYSDSLIAVMMRDRQVNDIGLDVLQQWYE
ncbi:hypothetical protein [Halalkalibacter hemicellulosilyticus]|uniref:Uncharacterized protein n=1 Tax=Halalkalibacter hemicellulosilyticusJCM 9152 TaxID=1236971 RepID=W4QAS2_9BACI|nr:hypothetical protein [Halalkalibacter hemicellulosilyticus]GAE29115.1 hypothetical protein JCM9152_456 [Halalkalibacter hemicellulosilyticusJCM 9152]